MEANDLTPPAETEEKLETVPVEEPPSAVEPPIAEESVSPEESVSEEDPIPDAESVSVEDLLPEADAGVDSRSGSDSEELRLRAIIEAVVYITDEPLTSKQIADALGLPAAKVEQLLDELVADYNRPERGLTIRELAGGYKMATKAEHHEAVRAFVKKLTPPLKLSMAALETLAVIAYKQPITSPEIMEIRGVQGAGVLKTLLDRKLITAAGRKAVVGRPVLYKTTKDFLVQFGLKELNELPTLKEFEELARLALTDPEPQPEPKGPQAETSEPQPAPELEQATEGSHG